MRGPLGAGLGGLPLYWSSFSHSTIKEHKHFRITIESEQLSGLGSFLDFSVSAQVCESESPGQFHLGDTHLVWWSSWGHRAAEGVGVGEEGMSLGHVRASAPLSHISLELDWCTNHAAPGHLCSPASNKCTMI